MATATQIDKAYTAYKKRTGVGERNKAGNRTWLTKAQFIKKNYPGYAKKEKPRVRTLGRTRTDVTEQGMKQAGLSYKEIKRFGGK